ncbi:MAG: hypothetical protein COY81_03700 [Candidatus Pacebacteria bacterium CG_4_10_14_0_8_um_filter_43_12]|nr:MAG: hypothetical protein COU66_02765 [Candidatus Pacebacteria bacterium CG10_big_fil_rev_8_21_14_0_10_44_11]PIY79236.1 MAG: hypothetical protein COY81_03700 [Candidatus Pacebacteria bacterium CG_4_10_14_0_8_um_filter_43_12]
MFPVLYSVGAFEFRTFNFFIVLAFLMTAFLFWKKGREEHYPEVQLFDGFLLATMVGFLAGRVGYVLSVLPMLGWSVFKWIDIFGYPGISGAIGVFAAILYLYHYAKEHKWDAFEILDFFVLSVAGGLGVGYIGLFFDGSAIGIPTELPWGVTFQGLQEPHHPTQLYFAIFFFLFSWYLARVEYKYRTYEWYRSGKKTAQTGFLVSVFVVATTAFYFAMSWFKPPVFSYFGVNGDRIVAFMGLLYGCWLLYHRSGRTLFHKKKMLVSAPEESSNETPSN